MKKNTIEYKKYQIDRLWINEVEHFQIIVDQEPKQFLAVEDCLNYIDYLERKNNEESILKGTNFNNSCGDSIFYGRGSKRQN
jgi:hypothetical protein